MSSMAEESKVAPWSLGDPFFATALGRALHTLPLRYFHAALEGEENIPARGGALLVGNHAMWGLDAVVLGALALARRGRYPRFLAERNLWRIPLLRDALDVAGVLPGEAVRATELLRAGALVAVYPGGIDDSWKCTTTQRYRLQWGTRAGFARIAVRAGVPIVPVVGLGIDEMFTVLGRERWLGRRVLGSPRYDLPIWHGAWGSFLPRRGPLRFVALPPVDTSGSADDPSVVERVRSATYAAIDGVLGPYRVVSPQGKAS